MKEENDNTLTVQQGLDGLYASIRNILASARQRTYSAVNFAMVKATG